MIQAICKNLTPNYHARYKDEKVYHGLSHQDNQVTYRSLCEEWNAHIPFPDKKMVRGVKRAALNDKACVTAQLSIELPPQVKKLDDLWRNTYVEPQWQDLNISQKVSSSSIKSYTYQLYKAEIELIKTVEEAFKSKGDYDITPAIAVLTLPLWAPIAALGFTILLPSVPLHVTEASLRFASQEAISRLARLKHNIFVVSILARLKIS